MNAIFRILLCAVCVTAAEPDYRRSPGYRAYEEASSLFAAQKFEESLSRVNQALDVDPALLPALTLKARLAMAARNADVARDALLQAVRVAPESWYAHFLLGFHYHLQNDHHEALQSLERARRLNPKQSQPHLYLGLTHETLGDTKRAGESYRQAIKLEESSRQLQAETLLTLARMLLLTGEWDECGRLIDKALAVEPESRDVHYELARLLMKKGDAANAVRAGEKALSLPPGGIAEPQIRYVLVRAHGLAGNPERAQEHAEILRKERQSSQ